MGRASRIAKGAAKRSLSAAGRDVGRFAKRATRAGYDAATVENCPHCGARTPKEADVCPHCGKNKR